METTAPYMPSHACSIKSLPADKWLEAAHTAARINPANAPAVHQAMSLMPAQLNNMRLAVLTAKFWGAAGVHLTVGFLDDPEEALKTRILSHMNAWSQFANVSFTETDSNPQVRISRTAGSGYWSYLGTDIKHIGAGKPTMNLDSFTMDTPESEFHRVVRHETGHTLGFPHEHMRQEIVNEINFEKAVLYFRKTQGWTRQEVIDQVLTPLKDSAIMATAEADEKSIMCYWLTGQIMNDGIDVPGGNDIDQTDADFAALMYPKP
jgi:hypothetical protein